jgi:hypothetical protein
MPGDVALLYLNEKVVAKRRKASGEEMPYLL